MIGPHEAHVFVFRKTDVDGLAARSAEEICAGDIFVDRRAIHRVRPLTIEVNRGTFAVGLTDGLAVSVGVVQEHGCVTVSSSTPGHPESLTLAERIVMSAILQREELGTFFRHELRQRKLKRAAVDYGLEDEPELDNFFKPVLEGGRLAIQSRLPGMLPITSPKLLELGDQAAAPLAAPIDSPLYMVVINRHKFYRNVVIDLMEAGLTKTGRPKPPFKRVEALDLAPATENPRMVRFFAAVAKFQQVDNGNRTAAKLDALRVIVQEGANFPFFYHDSEPGHQVSAKTLKKVKVAVAPENLCLSVTAEGPFYAVSGYITIEGKPFVLEARSFKFGYFLVFGDTFYFVDDLLLLSVMELLMEQGGKLLIHASRFGAFHQQLLDKLSDRIRITYPDIMPATSKQLADIGFVKVPKRIIYLSDYGSQVMIVPVVRYGGMEVAIRTEKQLLAADGHGNNFRIPRLTELEENFIVQLVREHPYLPEQLQNQLYYFYLHKSHFLNEEWFIPVFERWREAGIEIYGFDKLTTDKLCPYPVKIEIKVVSGINWFNATYAVRFGKQNVSLKKVQAALRNKHNYVLLDDGTKGMLPKEWIDKFSAYFQAGEVVGDGTVRFAKANYETVTALYDSTMLDDRVANEIAELRSRLADLEAIPSVRVPKGLNTTLRPYQRQGLNWLAFLDSLGFGGILADEMGLGKTVQIIAFMLLQRERGQNGTDLVVVPATLIFNWQRELAALAPSLRVQVLYGAQRAKSAGSLGGYDIVLTSYTTLLADIRFLKNFIFNYVYLDESQNVKNPESLRYKAVRQLQARNRIAISGTPFENSSFDLYGQLSVVCPGLLGNKRYFRDIYGKPIDQFKNKKRREELQQRIQSFVLRRTKEQVATDLPEKAVLTLYSDMGEDQRKIYDAYEKEFRDFICALSGEELDASPIYVLRGLTRLRQICNSPALLPDGMLNSAVSAKLELLREQINDQAPHHKIVMFSQFVAMLHLIERMLNDIGVPYVSLTGGTRKRQQVVTTFQENPQVRVFLVSLKAGGTGLNLTAADIAYLVDPWWNPAVEEQAIDRIHRIGQKKKVVAYRLVTPNSVEEKVLRLQAAKGALASGLLNSEASLFRTLDKNGLLALL